MTAWLAFGFAGLALTVAGVSLGLTSTNCGVSE